MPREEHQARKVMGESGGFSVADLAPLVHLPSISCSVFSDGSREILERRESCSLSFLRSPSHTGGQGLGMTPGVMSGCTEPQPELLLE